MPKTKKPIKTDKKTDKKPARGSGMPHEVGHRAPEIKTVDNIIVYF